MNVAIYQLYSTAQHMRDSEQRFLEALDEGRDPEGALAQELLVQVRMESEWQKRDFLDVARIAKEMTDEIKKKAEHIKEVQAKKKKLEGARKLLGQNMAEFVSQNVDSLGMFPIKDGQITVGRFAGRKSIDVEEGDYRSYTLGVTLLGQDFEAHAGTNVANLEALIAAGAVRVEVEIKVDKGMLKSILDAGGEVPNVSFKTGKDTVTIR
ncbi:MAG: hypothetical protein ACE5FA_01065 [Dehalococcoidia bacterium]